MTTDDVENTNGTHKGGDIRFADKTRTVPPYCVLVTADLRTLLYSSKNSNHSARHAKRPAQSKTLSLSVKFLMTPENTISTQIPWRTYLRTSTWIMFGRSWKRSGCTWKYRLGYNPENTTNQSTESKLLLNRNTIMLVLVEIVVRNNKETIITELINVI